MRATEARMREERRLQELRTREHDLLDKATHAGTASEAIKHAEELADTQLGEIRTRIITVGIGRTLKYTCGLAAIGLVAASGVGAAILPAVGAVVFAAMESDQKRLLREEKAEAQKNKTTLLESFKDHGFSAAVPSKKMQKFLRIEAEPEKPSRIEAFVAHVNDMFTPKKDVSTREQRPSMVVDSLRR